MAKKQTFADKLKKGADGKTIEYIKLVKAVRADNGAWRFKSQMVEINDDNRNDLYK